MQDHFYDDIKLILESARNKVYQAANFAMVEAYWQIGKSIVAEQGGEDRAEYGSGLIEELSKRMTKDFGKGFTTTNLKYMRQFYLAFPNSHSLRDQLSWTHYRLLMKVENDKARQFYLEEAVKSSWSTRQLERQINTFFYKRLLSSKDKSSVSDEINMLEPAQKPEDIIRDPYVLEFLDLNQNNRFYESDLEQALIDLKLGDLSHQDLGQMQMYVHYYEREMMNEGDNPPIGIVLCADKSDAVVRYTLPENEDHIYASKYKLYLPSEEELANELKKEYKALDSSMITDNKEEE